MRRFVFGIFMLVLAACSDDGPPVAIQAAPSGKAQVYLIRPSTIVGAGNLQLTRINGITAGQLQVGQYTIVPVEPGEVVVTFRERIQGPLPLLDIRILQELGGFAEVGRTRVEPGQSVFMRFPQMEWITAGQASVIMGGMTYVAPVGAAGS
jgi:hypothetical protein